MSGEFLGSLFTLGVLAVGAAAYDGQFYPTGRHWYESCWAKSKGGKASNPYQEARWSTCEPIASRAFFDAGLLFSSGTGDENAKRLASVCPSAWSDLYFGGNYVLGVKLVQERGGPSPMDGILPAGWLLKRTFAAKWPQCRAEADNQGYPRIVEKSPGVFGWERPCPPQLPCDKS